MAITKGTGTSLISAATSTTTSSAVDASSDYITEIYGSIAVVGSPSAGATVQVQVSPDGGTTYYSLPTLLYTAPLTAGTYLFGMVLPSSTKKYQVVYTAQTGGTSSTCTVQSNDVTGI